LWFEDNRAAALKMVEYPQVKKKVEKECLGINEANDFAYVLTFQSIKIVSVIVLLILTSGKQIKV
jgi:hypothetical protein